MTQAQLDHAVADATGVSWRTIHHRGISLLPATPTDLEPEDLRLVVTCPFCGRPAPLAAPGGKGPLLVECDRCDVEFDVEPGEVYVTSAIEIQAQVPVA